MREASPGCLLMAWLKSYTRQIALERLWGAMDCARWGGANRGVRDAYAVTDAQSARTECRDAFQWDRHPVVVSGIPIHSGRILMSGPL